MDKIFVDKDGIEWIRMGDGMSENFRREVRKDLERMVGQMLEPQEMSEQKRIIIDMVNKTWQGYFGDKYRVVDCERVRNEQGDEGWGNFKMEYDGKIGNLIVDLEIDENGLIVGTKYNGYIKKEN